VNFNSVALAACFGWLTAACGADFSHAVVVAPAALSGPEKKAVAMLVEEVEKRSQVRWQISPAWPADAESVVVVGNEPALRSALGSRLEQVAAVPVAAGAEGYRLVVTAQGAVPVAWVVGNDARGVLFGVGRMLRSLEMQKGRAALPADLRIATAPKQRIRGHQLGNRNLNNTVDAWTVPMWEQYFRDLAVFGANAVELLPPQANGWEDSPHSPLPLLDMMAECSRLLGDYGMDVWIWFPALAKDYSKPETVTSELEDWARVFRKLPHIDAVFVPGGDPGHTHPKHLMPFLEKQAESLRRYHPKAEMWVSPQGFDQEWLDEFFAVLRAEPRWLNGVVHGPGVRVSITELRAKVPQRYAVRTYPDITHTVRSSYPIPDWDPAWTFTHGREPINPRPVAQREIFRRTAAGSAGFVSYSDGSNDDVNKMVWSALGWDPETPVISILRDYGRYFIGGAQADDFAQGLLALERNWKGPILTNPDIPITLRQFQAMERAAAPGVVANWRFQQALYRAYYDGYVRNRLIRETALEERAMELLESAERVGSIVAMRGAEDVVDEAVTRPQFENLRARVFELGAALFQSIGMQLSLDLYKGYARGRAATLDTVDSPLNDRMWLKARFAEIRGMVKEGDRLKEIRAVVDWKNPGPGGFYDDVGNVARQPHVVREAEAEAAWVQAQDGGPLAWASYIMSGRRAPVRMHYTGLDPAAQYRVRVVYSGGTTSLAQGIRLLADDKYVVHPYMKKPLPVRASEFDVPMEATRDGELDLAWDREAPPSGSSRGAEVAEVWLIKKR
jgi:hypothetical protein